MIKYKKISKLKKAKKRILGLLNWISDETMIKLQYKIRMGKKLSLKKPTTFTEKIQWYKLFYRKSVMKECVDKYEVRKYVESKGLKDNLNELYGVYESFNYINIDMLPEKFVIKSTNGGGGINIIICNDKGSFKLLDYEKLIKSWMVIQKKSLGREWAYEGIKPRIIIEKYLENKANPKDGIEDYKFFCYNGKVEYVVVDIERYIDHKRNFYDKNWNYIEVESDCKTFNDTLKKPKEFEEMKEIAEKLSKDFPFVRVDLYCVEGKIYFGELTFYPWSGYVKFFPKEFDYELGKFITIGDKQ